MRGNLCDLGHSKDKEQEEDKSNGLHEDLDYRKLVVSLAFKISPCKRSLKYHDSWLIGEGNWLELSPNLTKL